MTSTPEMNLESLRANPYPGRGIVVGLDESGGALIQAYWIMGRSANSRNRVFEYDGPRLWTAPADPSAVKDPALIIYTAMNERGGHHVVTNGDQTDTIIEALQAGLCADAGLQKRRYEPDAPNFTPRISAICQIQNGAPKTEIAVLRKSPFGDGCDRHFFHIDQLGRGVGYCVTTYMGDGDPLPAFRGEPYLLPLRGDALGISESIWEALNAENRVALAVKSIDLGGREASILVKNRFQKRDA